MTSEEHITYSYKETQSLGESFAQKLVPGDFVAFYGTLGSGKTTFIQGMAKGLGIKRRIISPTFIIIRHYAIKNGNFYHVDLYRTGNKHDLLSIGLDQIIEDKNNIIALEWAEKMGEFLPQKRIDITCEYLGDDDKRKIIIKRYG
jgi:tRNA threonylcarbamoyladenosine biosynthesis protein TsaE